MIIQITIIRLITKITMVRIMLILLLQTTLMITPAGLSEALIQAPPPLV